MPECRRRIRANLADVVAHVVRLGKRDHQRGTLREWKYVTLQN